MPDIETDEIVPNTDDMWAAVPLEMFNRMMGSVGNPPLNDVLPLVQEIQQMVVVTAGGPVRSDVVA